MRVNDKDTLSIAATVSDVLEGKKVEKSEEVKYPHKMYDPKSGEEVSVKDEAEHEKYAKKGWVHEKPKVEVAEPEAEGEKEFKAKHVVKKSGANDDGTITKESKEEPEEEEQEDEVDEASEKQKKYQAFFAKALKKFGAKSPAELDKEKRKEFFNYVDKNYESDNEAD
ncbi:MAG: hypothetical protein HKN86_04000 [Acidimicrobiia bacterium]|nr:hypothetical protein [Acidimicrobiia bacterium]